MRRLISEKLNQLIQKFLWHSGLGNIHDIEVDLYLSRILETSRNPLLRPIVSNFSQSDEDGIIQRICQRIGITRGKFVEIGVGDGLENNTLLLHLQGWDGIWFGGQQLKIPKGMELPKNLIFNKIWVDKDSLENEVIPRIQEFGEVDLLSLDLDGNDFHFASDMLRKGLKPKIWVQEYNGNFPPNTKWIQVYDQDHRWKDDNYYGASLDSYQELFESYGYKLVACNLLGVNAFFVRSDLSKFFSDIPTQLGEVYAPARPMFRKMKQRVSPKIYLKRM